MQASKLSAINGLFWVRSGLFFFIQYPLNMLGWSLSLSLVVILALNIPILGLLMNIAFMPFFALISFSLGKRMAEGKSIEPSTWLEPLYYMSLSSLKNILLLGFIYSLLCIGAILSAFLPFLNELAIISEQLSSNTSIDLFWIFINFYKPLLILTIISIIINAFFWYAPVLIIWHNLNLFQSLFFSAVACWRNRSTFLVYGLIWILVFLAIDIITNILMKLGMSMQTANAIEIPLSLVVNGILWSSFYSSYSSVFCAEIKSSS